MAFNKNNKKLVTTALTAAMVASAVAPVAAAKLTPAQAATNAVKAYTNFKVTTISEASKSVASKNAALAAVKKLGSKDAKLKASLTASINNKDAAVKLVVANIQKADAAVKAYEATNATSVSAYKATGPVKFAAQKAVAALVSPGLKASYTAKIDAKFASLTDAYNKLVGDAAAEAKAIDDAKAALELAKTYQVTAETTVEQVEALFTQGMALINAIKTESVKADLTKQATDLKAAVLKKIEELKVVKVESVTVVDTNKIAVKFNNAIDASKVTVALKVGAATQYTTSSVSEDKKTVTLTAPTTIAAGDYSVVVSGIADAAVVTPLTVAAVAPTTITVSNTEAVIGAGSVATFVVANQYGSDMGVLGTAVAATAYNVTQNTNVSVVGSGSKSELTLDLTSAKVGDDVRVIVSYKGITITKTVKVIAAATVSDVSLGTVAPLTGKVRITAGEAGLVLPVTLKDQYGKDKTLTANKSGAAAIAAADGITFISSNSDVIDPTSIATDANGKVTFTAKGAGTATITAIINATGKVSSTTVVVNSAAALKTLAVSSPSSLVSAGQSVTLDLTGADQFGGVSTDFSGVTATVDGTVVKTGDATISNGKLVVKTSAAGTATVTLVKAGATLATLTFKVEAAAVPTAIVGVDSVNNLEATAVETLSADSFKVKDQYGRDFAIAASDIVSVTAVDGTFDTVAKDGVNPLKFTAGSTAGTEVVKFALANGASYNVSLATVATSAITSYTANTVGTLYAAGGDAKYNVALSVTGKLADGSKVVLANSKITHATSSNVTVATVDANGVVTGVKAGTSTITLWNGANKLADVVVTVSEATPVATTVEIDDATPFTATVGTTVNVAAKLTVKDQYGVAVASPVGYYATSDSSVATVDNTGVVTGVKAGKVTITYVTSNGIIKTTTVTIN